MKELAWLVPVALVAACGGKTDIGVPGQDAAVVDAGQDVFVHPTPSLPCPTAQPQDGTTCSHEGVQCEYGDDPRWSCNWIASCSNGSWSVTTSNDAWCPTPPKNPPACPASYASVPQGGACGEVDTPCQYPEGWCTCMIGWGPPEQDGGQPENFWECSSGPSAGCPSTRPRLGTSCAQPGVECDYAPCDEPSGLSVTCDPETDTWGTGLGAPCGGANGG